MTAFNVVQPIQTRTIVDGLQTCILEGEEFAGQTPDSLVLFQLPVI